MALVAKKGTKSLGDLIREQLGADPEFLEPVKTWEDIAEPFQGFDHEKPPKVVSNADRTIPLIQRLKNEALIDMLLVLHEIARVKREDDEELELMLEMEEYEEELGTWA